MKRKHEIFRNSGMLLADIFILFKTAFKRDSEVHSFNSQNIWTSGQVKWFVTSKDGKFYLVTTSECPFKEFLIK